MKMHEIIASLFNLSIFFLTAILCYFLTPFFIRISDKYGFLDRPEGRKAHKSPTPYLGGAAIFISFAVVFLPGLLLLFVLKSTIGIGTAPAFNLIAHSWPGILSGALLIFALGILDDYFNLSPWVKLLGQFGVAFIMIKTGLVMNLVMKFGLAGDLITFVWLVLIMNAFNFIDSIDGHCSGIALISCFVFFCISMIVYQPVLGFIIMTLGGALAGFLPYNMKPAKIFLGDNGSLFIGYMMAAITLICTYRTSPSSFGLTPLIPILMFGVPIYDTVSVIFVRILRGIPPWKGDRNHFAHRLSRLGMNEKIAALFSYFIALTLGLIAIMSTQVTTFLGNVLIIMLFISVISIVAFLEYYAAFRIRAMERMAKMRKENQSETKDEPGE